MPTPYDSLENPLNRGFLDDDLRVMNPTRSTQRRQPGIKHPDDRECQPVERYLYGAAPFDPYCRNPELSAVNYLVPKRRVV
jgi:hypothetical protein